MDKLSKSVCQNYFKNGIIQPKSKMQLIVKVTILLYCIVLSSCVENDIIYDDYTENLQPPFQIVKITGSKLKSSNNGNSNEEEYVLQFRDEKTFEQTIDVLDGMSMDERNEWSEQLTNFTSAAQLYEQAMAEAESYYDRPGGYEEFKAKYNMLYFPEYGDDYGAYLPYKNDIEIFCANENGRLMIGEEVINIDPLTTYDELIETGRAMIEVEPSGLFDLEKMDSLLNQTNTTRAVLGDNVRIDAFNITPVNAWQKMVVGDTQWQHSTGWLQEGKYKIIIKFTRKYSATRHFVVLPDGFRVQWHLEVAFRKKGFLGAWYNYRNNSDVTVNLTFFDKNGLPTNQRQTLRNVEQGFMSSHDMYSKVNVIRHITPSIYEDWTNVYDYYQAHRPYPRCVYEMPGYVAEINAYVGNFSYQRFGFSAPVLYGYTNFSSDKLE